MQPSGTAVGFLAVASMPLMALSALWMVLIVSVAIGLIIAIHHSIPRADD